MKICLVTGSTGFIGKRLVHRLLKDKIIVYGVSRNLNYNFSSKNYFHIKCDLLKSEIPKKILEKVDTIFHLAGYAHDTRRSQSFENIHKSLTLNASLKLARRSKKKSVRNFIYISTSKAGNIGENERGQNILVNEIDREKIYGFYKRETEIRLLKIFNNSKINFSIIRPSLVYGPNLKGNLGLMFKAIKWGVFPPIPSIKNKKSLIHVDDLIEAILLINRTQKSKQKIYIVSDGKYYSTYQIYKIFCNILNRKIPNWSIPISIFNFLKLNQYTRNKIQKLFEDDFYDTSQLTELGFKPKLNLKKIYEKNF